MNTRIHHFLSTVTFFLSLMGFSSMAAASFDSAEHHFKAAERYVAEHRLEDAIREYDLAIARDDELFKGWLGKGQAQLAMGDGEATLNTIHKLDDIRQNKSHKLEMLLLDAQYRLAFKPNGWFNDAKNDFFQARDIVKKQGAARPELYLTIARVYRDNGENDQATKHYNQVISMGGEEAALANQELALILHQSQAGGAGEGWVGELARRPTIDRATLMAVLVDEMDAQSLFPKRKQAVALSADARESVFAAAIEIILNLQISTLGLDKSGDFHPEQAVTRFELAKLIEEILVAYTGKESLTREYVGSKSPFPDLGANHYAFNAVFLAVSRGLIQIDNIKDGSFAGEKPVSGADLLIVLRKLESMK